MKGDKDAVEVIKFLALFAKLKGLGNDEPDKLAELAEGDEAIREHCSQLSWNAHFLKMNERRHLQLFAAPVDPKFVTEWRDFEERFESVLSDIVWNDLFKDLDVGEPREGSRADLQWEIADEEASEQASAIEGAIGFAYDQATQDWRIFDEEGKFRESIEDGRAAWQRLEREIGFDLRRIFRRRELVPFVLVPRHVAESYGSAETVSLFMSLKQAHHAFIFGAFFAAIGLMRSIVESTLRDHYGISGKNLQKRIENADRFLPASANAAALDRLRKLANAVLHSKERDEPLLTLENAQLEKDMVSLLYVLRGLIEDAPPAPPSTRS